MEPPPGKRLLKLKVIHKDGKPVIVARAILRAAVKLLAGELVHVAAFSLSEDMAQLSTVQTTGLILANVLIFVYFIISVGTKGSRSIHDFVAATRAART